MDRIAIDWVIWKWFKLLRNCWKTSRETHSVALLTELIAVDGVLGGDPGDISAVVGLGGQGHLIGPGRQTAGARIGDHVCSHAGVDAVKHLEVHAGKAGHLAVHAFRAAWAPDVADHVLFQVFTT